MPKSSKTTRFTLLLLVQASAAQAQGPLSETTIDLSSTPNRACYRATVTEAVGRRDLCDLRKIHPLTVLRAQAVLGAKLRLEESSAAIREATKDDKCALKPECATALQRMGFLKAQYRRELRAARAKARANGLQP